MTLPKCVTMSGPCRMTADAEFVLSYELADNEHAYYEALRSWMSDMTYTPIPISWADTQILGTEAPKDIRLSPNLVLHFVRYVTSIELEPTAAPGLIRYFDKWLLPHTRERIMRVRITYIAYLQEP